MSSLMSTRTRAVNKEVFSVDSMKRQMDFPDEPSKEMETDFLREPLWKTTRSYRVNFGETNPSMQFRCLDLLPVAVPIDFDTVAASPCQEKKTIFTDDQRAALEAKFQRTKYPTRKEKVKLASKLGLGVNKVQNWFVNRRRRWKKEQRKGSVDPSGVRSVLPRIPLAQTSCKRSFKSTMSIGCFPQLPAQRHDVQSQPLPSAPLLVAVPFATASHHVTQSFQSYTARSTGTQQRLQQPLAIPAVPSVTGTEQLPYQQVYSPGLFPGSVQRLPQQQLESNRLVQQTAASSYLTHYPPPPVRPVEPDFHQLPAADPRSLADEFPFSYSIANELPHIFGNLEDDEVLDRPLTPSFEPPTEREPWWDSMAIQSDSDHSSPACLTKEDCASPSYRHAQSHGFNSCRFSSSQMSSPSPLTELSCGHISKENNFSINRQD